MPYLQPAYPAPPNGLSRLWHKALCLIIVGLLFGNGTYVIAQQATSLYIQVGPKMAPQEAQNLAARLKQAGFQATIVGDAGNNGGQSQVELGPFASQADADIERKRLSQAGFDLGSTVPQNENASVQMTAEQKSLEAQALANLGGGEASQPEATGSDLEAQALQAMKRNEANAEAEEQQRQQRIAEQQAMQQQAMAQQPPAEQPSIFPGGMSAFTQQLASSIGQTVAQRQQMQQQVADIRAAAAQRQATARQTQVAADTTSGGGYTFRPTPSVNTFSTPPTGTAPAPVAPPAPPQPAAELDTLCPASGFVPGIMRTVASDVREGIPCTPGSAIYRNSVPQFDTTGTGLNPVITNTGGSGGVSPGNESGRYVSPLNATCITMDFNAPYHWDEYYNHCGQSVSLKVIFPKGYQGTIDPLTAGKPQGYGFSQSDYNTQGGYPSLYICPSGDVAVDANGNTLTTTNQSYKCLNPGVFQ